MGELPDFTAYEINELMSLARKDKTRYYLKALEFVLDFTNGHIKEPSEKQERWLWGLKKELREIVEENG